MKSDKRIAVVLFQLGGPDSLEAVEPFLYNLFCDPDIINFPGAFLARKPLARLISTRRSKIVEERYMEIGGKSPIIDLTHEQARALQMELNRHFQASVYVAMRYWHPFTGEVIAELKEKRFDKLILLPLYPQCSKATTVSSLNEWKRQSERLNFNSTPTETIHSYHNHPLYIEAIVARTNSVYEKFSGVNPGDIDLVFSAHGVPLSLIEQGDPYQQQVEETVQLVVAKGRWQSPHVLCYQSKVGPAEWLKPSLTNTIRELALKGRKRLLVIPIAFVTEHIETLHEINIEAREDAARLGIDQFEMMPAINSHPKFIECLSDLVLKNI